MMFRADAPAPLMPTPVAPPMPAATEAASEKTLMSASEVALTVTPAAVLTSAPASSARTTPSITLRARDTPSDSAAPVDAPMPAAIEAAPANAVMLDALEASAATALALMTLARVPAANAVRVPACTRTPIWFSAQTPEALTPTPVPPPRPTATEPETTSASMVWLASALKTTSPSVSIRVSSATARTVAIASSPTAPKPSWPIRLRATEMPMDAPTPVDEPAPTAADSEAMVAEIRDWLTALRSMFSVALTSLKRRMASVEPLKRLTATAPAPLNAMPAPPAAMPMAADAATDTALMLLRAMLTAWPSKVRTKLLPSASVIFQDVPASMIETASSGSTSFQLTSSE